MKLRKAVKGCVDGIAISLRRSGWRDGLVVTPTVDGRLIITANDQRCAPWTPGPEDILAKDYVLLDQIDMESKEVLPHNC